MRSWPILPSLLLFPSCHEFCCSQCIVCIRRGQTCFGLLGPWSRGVYRGDFLGSGLWSDIVGILHLPWSGGRGILGTSMGDRRLGV